MVCVRRLLAARVAADGVAVRPLLADAPKGGELAHAQVRAAGCFLCAM